MNEETIEPVTEETYMTRGEFLVMWHRRPSNGVSYMTSSTRIDKNKKQLKAERAAMRAEQMARQAAAKKRTAPSFRGR